MLRLPPMAASTFSPIIWELIMLVSLPEFRVTVPLASMTVPVWVTKFPFSVPLPEPNPPVSPIKLPRGRPKEAPSDQEEELVLPPICCMFWAASMSMS